MALGSQASNVDALSGVPGLVHSVFRGDVLPGVRFESPTASIYMNAQEGDYTYNGKDLNFATDLLRPVGAVASDGKLPDSDHQDAANGLTTPVRRYVRRAVDNRVEAGAVKGEGSFGDLGQRMFDQMWGAFRLMEIRHAIGGSDGILCLCSSRTSTTVWVAKSGYNHASTGPLMLIDEGMVLTHHSTDGGAAEGAGKVLSIVYSTATVTMAADWETGSGSAAIAANDIVCAATTATFTADYFLSENNLAKNGQADIIDPDGNLTTVHGISQSTYPRWKPVRKASATWGHLEFTEFMQFLEAKSTQPVTPESHTAVMSGGVYAELARTLEGFQMQTGLGKTFEGGYTAVRVAGHDIVKDPFQLHDVMSVYCTEALYTVSLVEQGYFDDDGSMYSRISDFDGKEWYARDYCNSFCTARNRNGALTAIATPNVTDGEFNPTPDY